MTVTQITEISKTKVKLCIDEGASFALYKNELGKFGLDEGAVLPEGLYHQIVDDILPKRAKLRCMNLLKCRDYTEHQLRVKLEQGAYPQKIIDDAIAHVASYGYVDDLKYARAYIRQASGTKSRMQVENSLLQRGISRDDIEQAFAQCMQEDALADEEEAIARLLAKKHFDSQEATYEERQKMIRYLYRRGFSMDKIYRAVEYNA